MALSSDWLWETDADDCIRHISVDAAALGMGPVSLIGQTHRLGDPPRLEGHDHAAFHARMAARLPVRDVVFGMCRPGGPPFELRISGDLVFDAGCFTGYRGVSCGVTQATVAGLQVLQLARFDSLTGLANRSMFMDQLRRALQRAEQGGHGVVLLFIDLDRFIPVNDTLGHVAGNGLLKVTAGRLTLLLRGAYCLARLGGDAFVALLGG